MTDHHHHHHQQQQHHHRQQTVSTTNLCPLNPSLQPSHSHSSPLITPSDIDSTDEPADAISTLSKPHSTQALRLMDSSAASTEDSDSERTSSGSESPSLQSQGPTHCRPPKGLSYIDTSHTLALTNKSYTANENISPPISPSSSLSYDPSAPASELPPAGASLSYVSSKLEARVSHTGSGVFALCNIVKDEILIVWTGRVVTTEQAIAIMSTPDRHYLLQVGDGFYQSPLQAFREPADWTNHSCNPNAGFGAQSPICLTAMRDIEAGAEITFDYCMCELDERLWEPMECMCGAEECRRWITVEDHKLPQLWVKYNGYFSPHVQRRVNKLREARKAETEKQFENKDKTNCLLSNTDTESSSFTHSMSRSPVALLKSIRSHVIQIFISSLDRSLALIGLQRINKQTQQQQQQYNHANRIDNQNSIKQSK